MDLDSLEKKRLTDLRIYGRSIGVKCASALKKAELIQGIKDVLTGAVKPEFAKSGRRPMEFFDLMEAAGEREKDKNGVSLKFPQAVRFANAVNAMQITQEELRAFEKVTDLFIKTLRELI